MKNPFHISVFKLSFPAAVLLATTGCSSIGDTLKWTLELATDIAKEVAEQSGGSVGDASLDDVYGSSGDAGQYGSGAAHSPKDESEGCLDVKHSYSHGGGLAGRWMITNKCNFPVAMWNCFVAAAGRSDVGCGGTYHGGRYYDKLKYIPAWGSDWMGAVSSSETFTGGIRWATCGSSNALGGDGCNWSIEGGGDEYRCTYSPNKLAMCDLR